MNEEHIKIPSDPLFEVSSDDPIASPNAESTGGEELSSLSPGDGEATFSEGAVTESDADPVLFADPVSAPDPDSGAASPQSEANGLFELRAELTRLRGELDSHSSVGERLGKESREFAALYPDVDMASLPDTIWEEVGRGIPLAAAYALSERRRQLATEEANRSNRENRLRSAGAVIHRETDYFSPEEVRAMTQSEVRANYEVIKRSMQSWR